MVRVLAHSPYAVDRGRGIAIIASSRLPILPLLHHDKFSEEHTLWALSTRVHHGGPGKDESLGTKVNRSA